jgi:hypothetical protein
VTVRLTTLSKITPRLRFGIGVVVVLCSSQSGADTWQQVWSARASTEYDSNPAMIRASQIQASQVEVWRSIFEPSYTLHGTNGVNEMGAGLALQVARSSNKVLSPNREDARGFLNWQRHNDKGEFGLSGVYDEAATRNTAIDNTGPGFADSTRASRTLSAQLSQALSERTNFGLDGSYEKVSYKGGAFTDYVSRSGGMKLDYAWSEYSVPFFRVSYADYKPDYYASSLSRLTNVVLGCNWKISDYLQWSLQGGRSKVDGAKASTQGAATIQYSGQRARVDVNASRQVTTSGLGGFIKVDQAKGGWSYIWSEHSKIGIDLAWQKNHYITTITQNTTGTWLQYDTNQFWRTRMYYLHKVNRDALGKAYSNVLGVAVTYTPAGF